jgi:hypothetical protein
MVYLPEQYQYSSHRAYLGLAQDGLPYIDPVLRLFGRTKEVARDYFNAYVAAGIGLEYPEGFDSPAEGYILGSDEFVDTTIHRIGDTPRHRAEHAKKHVLSFDASALILAIETVFGMLSDKFCGPEKSAKAVQAKEVLILIGREQGAGVAELSLIAGLDTSNVSRRYDTARQKLKADRKLAYAKDLVEKKYQAEIAKSQA